MMMSEDSVLELLRKVGAIITDNHFVYTQGKHGSAYINKDAVYPHIHETYQLCRAIAEQFSHDNVEVVVGPALGGIILSQWVAHNLRLWTGADVKAVYAEKSKRALLSVDKYTRVKLTEMQFTHALGDVEVASRGLVELQKGDALMVEGKEFVIQRGYDKFVQGQRVLVVEDILNTGGSVLKVVEAVRAAGGEVVGLGALCNRGGVTPEQVGNPPKLFALANFRMDMWDETDCPLCAQGVPINTDVGKGREYLARKQAQIGLSSGEKAS